MEDWLWEPVAVQISVAERMTGVPARLLRHYHRRGWIAPSEVDPATGHRRYTRDDVRRLRLLAALRRTGVPAARAATIAAAGDREAVLDHLATLESATLELRALLPPPRDGRIMRFRWPAEVMVELPVPAPDTDADGTPGGAGGDGERAAVSALLARLAAGRGCGVEALWDALREEGAPDGPVLRRSDGPPGLVLCLPAAAGPWPPDTTRQTWLGVPVRACRVTDGFDVAAAHRALDEAVSGGDVRVVGARREVLGADLRCRLVAAPVLPTRR